MFTISPLLLQIIQVVALVAIALGLMLLWRGVRSALRHRRKKKTENAEDLAAQAHAASAAAPSSAGSHDYLLTELRHTQLRLTGLEKTDIQHAAMDMRRRALQAEWQACDGGQRRDHALPVVLPAYIGIGKDLLAGAAKRQLLLKEKLQRCETQLAPLLDLQAIHGELVQSLKAQIQTGLRLHEAANGDGEALQELGQLLDQIAAQLNPLQGARAPSQGEALKQNLEQGKQLGALMEQGNKSLLDLRQALQPVPPGNERQIAEISQLQQRLKQSEGQLRDANDCVTTLEKNLDEARELLKKLMDRSRRLQEQDTRIAILEARSKQAEKESRVWQRLHKELEEKQQKPAASPGSNEQAQPEQAAQLERLRYENLMLEEQVVEMDDWRERAETAEAALRRSQDERLMLEQQILNWSSETDLQRTEARLSGAASQ